MGGQGGSLRFLPLPSPNSEVSDADPEASPRVPQHGGMSLHAEVAVPARDRHRLERLCRYVARPPLASERLEARCDGALTLRLKTRWRDGTTHILMQRSQLLERLVPLIPPPHAHQVRYHGILAPGASHRDRPRRANYRTGWRVRATLQHVRLVFGHDALLVRAEECVQTALGRQTAGMTARWLHVDHVCTKIREELAAGRRCDRARETDHPLALERKCRHEFVGDCVIAGGSAVSVHPTRIPPWRSSAKTTRIPEPVRHHARRLGREVESGITPGRTRRGLRDPLGTG